MEKFYSQHGEDFLMNLIFNGKSQGFFVEVGCLDGIEFSNTFYFEKKGWKGICIEAHNGFIEKLKENRPDSTVVHCAVGEKDEKNVTFYANKIGSLSTLDKSEEARWVKNYGQFFTGFEEQIVEKKTLTTIFNEYNIEDIDFISLDIEGYEIKALEGLDLLKYKPKILIIEYKDNDHKNQIEKILFKHNYFYLTKIGCNLIYSIDKKDKQKINKNFETINLVQVKESGEEILIPINIKNSTITLFINKVKRFLSLLLNTIRK